MPLGVANLVDTLFPDANSEVASVRQAALLIVPNVQTPSELLDQLRSAIMQPELPGTQDNFIRIMSLHKSKGLTARLVLIAACVSGIVPTIDYREPLAEQNRKWQEQRRLFYVGITRSTETLVLSGAVSMPFGPAKQMNVLTTAAGGTHASPFLAELGPSAPTAVTGADWRAQLRF
jgi:superfamily I DNA/RNA helicase